MPDKFDLALQIAASHPHAVARYLEDHPSTVASSFIDAVPDNLSAALLESMLPYHAAKCIDHISAETAAKYISTLELRYMVSILRHTRMETRDAVVAALPRHLAARAGILLRYPLSVIGAWINPTIMTLPADCRASDAKERLLREGYVDFHRVYVVEGDQRLVGSIRLYHLLHNDDTRLLNEFMDAAPQALRANTSLELAIEDPKWTGSDYLPVVDRQDRFIGVLRFADIRAAVIKPKPNVADGTVSDTFLDLAETCYLGLADVMNTSLAAGASGDNKGAL